MLNFEHNNNTQERRRNKKRKEEGRKKLINNTNEKDKEKRRLEEVEESYSMPSSRLSASPQLNRQSRLGGKTGLFGFL